MPNWDEESAELRGNLERVLGMVRDAARRRERPGMELVRSWHAETMRGLEVPFEGVVGRFRGEPGLEECGVRIGRFEGVPPWDVAAALEALTRKLRAAVARLDELVPRGEVPGVDQVEAILDLCAWMHGEWVRIHPFGNGNGRTTRLWVHFLAMRYGLPPFLRVRPRPGGPYGYAAEQAMLGNRQPTRMFFRELLREALGSRGTRYR